MSGGGGGSKSTTTTQKTEPWKGLQPYLESAYPQLGNLYGTNVLDKKGKVVGWQQDPNAGPQYFPGDTVAGLNPWEGMGQDLQLQNIGAADWLSSMGNRGIEQMMKASDQGEKGLGFGQQGIQNLLGFAGGGAIGEGGNIGMQAARNLLNAGDPSSNPYFQGALESAIRPVAQQFNEQVMPGIRRNAIAAGQAGGSRQGIAEGIAGRGFADAIGDIATNMGNQAYGQGLQAMQAGGGLASGLLDQGLGAAGNAAQLGLGLYGQGLDSAGRASALAPTVQQMGFQPGSVAERIGQQRTADTQQRIDADVARHNYEQQLPFTMMSDYLGMLQGAPWGSTTGTQTAPGRSTVGSMLGGGLMGAGLMAGTPYMLPGALAGGMLGLF